VKRILKTLLTIKNSEANGKLLWPVFANSFPGLKERVWLTELNHCDQRASTLHLHNETSLYVCVGIPEAVLQVLGLVQCNQNASTSHWLL